MAIRIAMGHVDDYDESVAAFARQLGLAGVQLHCPVNLPVGEWSVADLVALRERCEGDGLRLEGLENLPPSRCAAIFTGGPGRDEQIEGYQRTVRSLAAAGIHLLGYHTMCTYVWRTSMGAQGRGGARVSSFRAADIASGNALAAYKLTPRDADGPDDPEELWANHQYFLDAVLPVAEEVGVRLAMHPDDPPVDLPLGGAPRIMTSPAALRRAHEQSGDSPAWALNLCLGTVSEMGGMAAVSETIEWFGTRGRIAYVHFRDVRGGPDDFAECFLGEGNMDVPAVVQHLHRTGFDGFLIDDHVPAVVGDRDTWADTSPAAYVSRGRAHAIGYLQGVIRACAADT